MCEINFTIIITVLSPTTHFTLDQSSFCSLKGVWYTKPNSVWFIQRYHSQVNLTPGTVLRTTPGPRWRWTWGATTWRPSPGSRPTSPSSWWGRGWTPGRPGSRPGTASCASWWPTSVTWCSGTWSPGQFYNTQEFGAHFGKKYCFWAWFCLTATFYKMFVQILSVYYLVLNISLSFLSLCYW